MLAPAARTLCGLALTGLFAATPGCSTRKSVPATPVPTEAPSAQATASPLQSLPIQPGGGGGGVATVRTLDVKVERDPTRIVLPAYTPGLRPALIFLHGHNQDRLQLTDQTSLATAATQAGWIAAAGDFTGKAHWGNDGALRAVGALIHELVETYDADPKRIYLVGFSMGGGTALLATANPLKLPYQVAAVVSTQGFSDLREMTTKAANFGGFVRSVADAYGGAADGAMLIAHSPKFQAAGIGAVPVYLEHGEADTVVPPSHTVAMASALTAAGHPPVVRLYPGKGHNETTIDTPAIMDFLTGKQAP